MNIGQDAAQRAQALVGTRFRPQGRDPGFGLDCVGLALAAHQLAADGVRRDYRLKGDHRAEIIEALTPWFRRVWGRDQRPGDLLLLRCGRDQYHLAIQTIAGMVHADAAIGRVVATPGAGRWPLVARFRRRAQRNFTRKAD